MKRLLIIALLMTTFTQAFAGILENRQTGETIEFNVDRNTRTVEILSMANKVENKTIEMKSITRDRSDIKIYGITDRACEAMYGTINGLIENEDNYIQNCLLIPLLNVPGIIVGAVETLMLPFKGTIKLIQSMSMKKDFKKLMRAINSTQTIVVSERRFRRIETLLQ